MEVYLIQLYGRWHSSAVARYVQDAPLTRVAAHSSSKAPPLEIKDLVRMVAELIQKHKSIPDAVDELLPAKDKSNNKALVADVL